MVYFSISSRNMGLGHSKAHPRVIKVTPLQSQEAETPSTGPVFFALNRNLEEKSSFTRLQDQNRTLEGQLPPLRETLYGRLPAVPRAIYLDIPLKHEETSIIKRHPPRRIQQENEKKTQRPAYASGKRQYLHKMKMLEMNHKRQEAQMELRKSLLRKAMLDMQKQKGHNGNKITQSKSRSNSNDILSTRPDDRVNRQPEVAILETKPTSVGLTTMELQKCQMSSKMQKSPAEGEAVPAPKRNRQDEEFLDYHTENDYCVRKIGKMETWLREQEAQGQLFWDSSSSDSGENQKDERRPQALVRTKTEKIPLYDDFYDSV